MLINRVPSNINKSQLSDMFPGELARVDNFNRELDKQLIAKFVTHHELLAGPTERAIEKNPAALGVIKEKTFIKLRVDEFYTPQFECDFERNSDGDIVIGLDGNPVESRQRLYWKRRFPEQWALFEQKQSGAIGTNLRELGALSTEEVLQLNFVNIRTIEQLAEISEESLARFGNRENGQPWSGVKSKAVQYLSEFGLAQNYKEAHKKALNAMRDKDSEIAELKAMLAQVNSSSSLAINQEDKIAIEELQLQVEEDIKFRDKQEKAEIAKAKAERRKTKK